MELMETYYNANHAFNSLRADIIDKGIPFANTKALFNIGFYLQNPLDNKITNKERNWKEEYAEAEWQWYLSGDRNIKKLGDIYGKIPPIWERMADHNGNVNSNYGWQWLRNDQYEYIIDKLKFENDTRHAAISIYDCKENLDYENDTPCTYAVQFTIINDRLCMSVYMRSNDLWYGFCNDQYCFSMLQKKVAEDVNKDIGWYYHHAHNMHLYNDKL
jgi:thymidylate synthase|tara:strand:- start:1243 stop:1890 length:648 start_codon:yes stop_codon:yes gene_type:complete